MGVLLQRAASDSRGGGRDQAAPPATVSRGRIPSRRPAPVWTDAFRSAPSTTSWTSGIARYNVVWLYQSWGERERAIARAVILTAAPAWKRARSPDEILERDPDWPVARAHR
jgi:hypothetical protein